MFHLLSSCIKIWYQLLQNLLNSIYFLLAISDLEGCALNKVVHYVIIDVLYLTPKITFIIISIVINHDKNFEIDYYKTPKIVTLFC